MSVTAGLCAWAAPVADAGARRASGRQSRASALRVEMELEVAMSATVERRPKHGVNGPLTAR
jgi:hypothetical protein